MGTNNSIRPNVWMDMDAPEVFIKFAKGALRPDRADRLAGLAATKKGQRKILDALNHDFERAIRLDVTKAPVDRESPCFGFHASIGFGAEFLRVTDAYKALSAVDAWLIVTTDGSGGIYRPEARWDAEIEVVIACHKT